MRVNNVLPTHDRPVVTRVRKYRSWTTVEIFGSFSIIMQVDIDLLVEELNVDVFILLR